MQANVFRLKEIWLPARPVIFANDSTGRHFVSDGQYDGSPLPSTCVLGGAQIHILSPCFRRLLLAVEDLENIKSCIAVGKKYPPLPFSSKIRASNHRLARIQLITIGTLRGLQDASVTQGLPSLVFSHDDMNR
jgi:hypothetical protein